MNSLAEYLLYCFVRAFAFIIKQLPLSLALAIGRFLGFIGYYLDAKHKSIAYANVKIAFAKSKKPSEIKRIVKGAFQNYGLSLIELFRLPVMYAQGYQKFITVEGKENVQEALKKKKGAILLAMHFGSWEVPSLVSAILEHPYRIIVNPQKRFMKLNQLLNAYRQCAGTKVFSRGWGMRDLIESLRRNEIIGMVADQGGKDGTAVRFFGKSASIADGAIRIALKYGTPICFSLIIRGKGSHHHVIFNPELTLVKTGNHEKDVIENLNKITALMERYITQYPSQYMWFYKIWKYSKERKIVVLSDNKAGHLRQSEAIAKVMESALKERGWESEIEVVNIEFQYKFYSQIISLLSFCSFRKYSSGQLHILKWLLTKKSFKELASVSADYIISCGSSMAGVNMFLSRDLRAKKISVLKPGILGFRKFDLVVLPYHDKSLRNTPKNLLYVQGAPNLIDETYLKEQSKLLLKRYTHLQSLKLINVGVLLGGDNKNLKLEEQQVRKVMNQIQGACEQINADILITTSRRTSPEIEGFLQKEVKNHPHCQLLVIANKNNISEAVGGILGLSDIVVVSGDSISMVSEAASSGKKVIVFPLQKRKGLFFSQRRNKYDYFIEKLNTAGHVIVTSERNVGQMICDMAKNKIKTKPINNDPLILEAIKRII